jgi:hypothetical protein
MASVYLLSSTPASSTHGQLEYTYLHTSADNDKFGDHHLTNDPALADIILFAEREDAAGNRLERVRNHYLFRSYPEKSFVFNPRYKGIPYLPGVYASLPVALYNRRRFRSGHYPEVMDNDLFHFSPPRPDATYLYSFSGVSWTAPVRQHLLRHCDHPRSHLRDTTSSDIEIRKVCQPGPDEVTYMRDYADLTRDSKFVLCPRGTGVSSLRLFETMRMGRVPVILSDDWVPPEGPEWQRMSVRISEAAVESLPERLLNLEPEAIEMGYRAREAWEEWFSPQASFHRVVEWCLDILSMRLLPERLMHPLSILYYLHPGQILMEIRQRKLALVG